MLYKNYATTAAGPALQLQLGQLYNCSWASSTTAAGPALQMQLGQLYKCSWASSTNAAGPAFTEFPSFTNRILFSLYVHMYT